MDQQQVRSWYVDSRACEEQEDGSLTLNLYENVELTSGHVCYIDDLSISGTTPNVAGNNRLYLWEYTPFGWTFLNEKVSSYNPLDATNRFQQTELTIVANDNPSFSEALKVRLDNFLQTIYFDVDDTGLHWSGKIQRDGASDSQDCAAQYAYLTGVATWTGAVPIAHRSWTFGDKGDVVIGAPYSTRTRRGRGIEILSGEYTVSSLAVALEFALNGRAAWP